MLKFGGTSLASPKDIKDVAKTIASFSKDNQIVVVCSAVDGVTDDLILISKMIEQKKKKDVAKTLDELIKKHRKLADQTIKNSTIKKQLVEKLSSDISELQELVRGLTLLKEVSVRSLDYLISEGLGSQITMAHDVCLKPETVRYGGRGFAHILDSIIPRMLKRGISQQQIDAMLIDNPAKALKFK